MNTNQTYYWIQTPFVFENQTPFLASSVLNATAQFLLNQIPLGFSQSFILNPNYKKALKTALERLRQNPNIQQNVVFEYEYYNGANLTNLKYGATLTKAELNEKNYQQWFSKTLKFQKKEVKKSIMHTFFNMLDNITFYTNDWNLYQFKYVNHEWITTLIKTPKEITYQNFFNLLEQTKFINGYQYLYDYYLTSLSGGINNDFYFQLKLNHLPYLFLNYHVNQDSFQFNKDVPYNSHYIPKFHLNLDDLWKNKPNKIYSANLILYNNKKLNH